MILLDNSRSVRYGRKGNQMRAIVGVDRLGIDKALYDFVCGEAMPGTGIEERVFWSRFAVLVQDLAPRNAALLQRRDELQSKIDAWHLRHPGAAFDHAQYKAYLLDIGYLTPEQAPFSINTANVDPEIAHIAGPQLVVPVNNARYALNAANARWGSLYDALYGTDAIAETEGAERGRGLNPVRAARVVERARAILDQIAPLAAGSHAGATGYAVRNG